MTAPRTTYRVGVDIGGTFTDFAVIDSEHRLYTLKVSSSPSTPGREITVGLSMLKERHGIEPSDIVYFTHGTTVGVNALIQRAGAPVALFCTENFEDVLELGRLKVPDMSNLLSRRPRPLVPRRHVFPVAERIDSKGRVRQPLDETSLARAVAAAQAAGCTEIVVAFLHAYRNPQHENEARRLIAARAPDMAVTCSSAIWPVIREYERTLTAVINAYVRPKIATYLTSLQENLKAAGAPCELQIAKSNGGVMRAELGKSACVDILLSGTASGVSGATYVAGLSGYRNVVTVDIGGTSADVALIIDGAAQHGVGQRVGEFTLNVPAVAVSSIGGGGGSIASVDDHGVLKSGPESAGSEPGPACYGRGGKRPTTTDAFAVCGVLGQADLAYGAVQLSRDQAREAVATLAGRIGSSVEDTAQTIIDVAVSGMFAETSKVFSRYAIDPKQFVMLAFGGAGPMMACHLAREIGLSTVLIPRTPGVLSAMGGLVSDTKNDFVRTVFSTLDTSSMAAVTKAFQELAVRARAWFSDDQNQEGEAQLRFSADMRYVGQGHELETVLDEAAVLAGDVGALTRSFHETHEANYGFSDAAAPVQIVNARIVISGANPKPDFPAYPVREYLAAPIRQIEIYCDGAWRQAGVHERSALSAGAMFPGPAVVMQDDTTTCVLPGFTVRVDAQLNLLITQDGRQTAEVA